MPFTDLILNIRKPIGWTSFDVVRLVKNKISAIRVGHAGTLDPFAEGVLLICTGKETKNIHTLISAEKEYLARIRLGYETDTLDISGHIVQKLPIPPFSEKELLNVARRFIGEIEQIPPRFSALKVDGKRWFELARAGKEGNPKPRIVKITNVRIEYFTSDTIEIRVFCSKGTYIRSLARDFATCLGTVGFLNYLQRIRIGDYTIKNAIEVTNIEKTIKN